MKPTAAAVLQSMAMSDEAELLTRAADGDQRAWAELVDRYERLVWAVVRTYRLGDGGSADVAQTVWLKLAQYATRIREPEHLAAWLATTARNEALRLQKRHDRVDLVDEWADHADTNVGDPEDRLIDDELHAQLHAAMEQLAEPCQQLLRLLSTDPPLDYQTISQLTGRPIGSIGPTRGRCLNELRKKMGMHS